jgi:hypothetical protein
MGSIPTAGMMWIFVGATMTGFSVVFGILFWRSFSVKTNKLSAGSPSRLVMSLARTGRGYRLNRFETVARGVLSDVEDAMQPPVCYRHARSFLPLLSDVLKHGQILLRQQTMAHRVAYPDREEQLSLLVTHLFTLESKLRSLPKQTISIEDVLAGKFE